MQVEIKLDGSYIDPKAIILTASMTEEVSSAVKKLSEEPPPLLLGYKGEMIEILEENDLIQMYANSGKVFAMIWAIQFAIGKYNVKKMNEKLYQAQGQQK